MVRSLSVRTEQHPSELKHYIYNNNNNNNNNNDNDNDDDDDDDNNNNNNKVETQLDIAVFSRALVPCIWVWCPGLASCPITDHS